MGYPNSLITDTIAGVDIYPPQNGQAFGTYTGNPGTPASPDHPTWMQRISDEMVAVQAALGLPSSPASGSILATLNAKLSAAPSDGNLYVQKNATWVQSVIQADAPSDGSNYARNNGAWSKSPIQADAPSDTTLYGRQNAGWVRVPPIPIQADAPSDGSLYGRQSGNWAKTIPDAASDGNLYVRKNGGWTQDPIQADAPSDGTVYARMNGGWTRTANVQIFTTAGNFAYNVPPGATVLEAIAIGAGAGGGSGRKGASGTACAGGIGGGAGAYSIGKWSVAALGNPTVLNGNVGGAGIGGLAVTANDTNGNNATWQAGINQDSWFGCTGTGAANTRYYSLIYASAGPQGFGGSNAGFAPSGTSQGTFPGVAQAASSITAAPAAGATPNGMAAGVGGTGGGISAAGVAFAGSTGGSCGLGNMSDIFGWGTGGANTGANGTNANPAQTGNRYLPGSGGGGGGANLTGNGGNGGNGANYGGGGGGGGAALDNQGNSGAGGNGTNGLVMVIAHF